MADYSSQTVAQLKEILKSKGLATNGVKSDLIQRLEEADKQAESGASAEGAASATGPDAADATATGTTEAAAAPAEPIAAAGNAPASTEAAAEPVAEPATDAPAEAPKPKPFTEYTPEERKVAALDLLNKKLTRAKKFGDETSAEAIKKDISRIEKFGIELGTSIAKEIGHLVNPKQLTNKTGHRKHFKKPFKKFRRGSN